MSPAQVDGSTLHAEWLTEAQESHAQRPIVLLHGFTQNTRCWGPFGEAIGNRHPTLAVDAPGHGGSAPVHADLPSAAVLLANTIEASVAAPVTMIGYSMGGRIALHLALLRPDLVANLVVIGATAGVDDEAEREARRALDEGLADHLIAVGIERFIDEWLAQPLFAGLTAENACRSERLANDPEGLASSLRLAGTGAQEPLWDRVGNLVMPVLVLAGSDDTKFGAVAQRLAAAIGTNATVELVDGAGHAIQIERPAETAAIIESWLNTVDPTT